MRITKKILQHKTNFLWGIVLILFIYFVYYSVVSANRSTHGFITYYTAAKLILNGENAANFYDDEWFSTKVKDFDKEVYEIYQVNLPTTPLFFLPFSFLDYTSARITWILINIILFFTMLMFLVKELGLKSYWLPLIFILSLSFQPLYANVLFGQAYIIIFCLLVMAWYAYKKEYEMLLGIALGLVLIFKSAVLIIWLLLLLQKRWRSILWGTASAATVVILSFPLIGNEAWIAYSDRLIEYLPHPSLSVSAYQSVHSFFHHLTFFDAQWNALPLINLPLLATVFTYTANLSFIGLCSYFALKEKKSELVFGMFVIAGVILSPASIDYHYLILLLPILILINQLRKGTSVKVWLLTIFCSLMIAIDLPYTSSKITGGALALFAYPKLFGAAGLIIISIILIHRNNDFDENSKVIE